MVMRNLLVYIIRYIKLIETTELKIDVKVLIYIMTRNEFF